MLSAAMSWISVDTVAVYSVSYNTEAVCCFISSYLAYHRYFETYRFCSFDSWQRGLCLGLGF